MVINIALLQPHVQHIFPVSAAIPPRCVLNQVLDALWELRGLVHRDDAFTWAPGKPKRGDSKRGRSVGKCGKLIYKWMAIYPLKFILPKYFGRLCRYYFVWSVLRKPCVSQKTHTNLMKTRRYAKKIGDESGLGVSKVGSRSSSKLV
jgi:hypothetical protein